jgi:hypothetical protein
MIPMTPKEVVQKLVEERGLTQKRKDEICDNKRREARNKIFDIEMERSLKDAI